ncbi:response regulator [Spirosoma endophyticum]|uniref:Response regulator receiver domain-containing protein n=1 Tax=Spirosoma endophyticum TaxID=662367 RepID=A0A1I1LCT7_9BACT|nr:response regulator [Spirosoma endophyticum]SFC70884.1 Response regulator receiver domain-containing protein [Spirosoma endophyticum]
MDEHPIIFIDADEDDHDMFKQALAELALPHPILLFSNCQTALDYLTTNAEIPFLIISEISMPGMSGLELRKQIDQDPVLRRKCIPFIFMTNPVEDYLVEEAYELTIQGLFEKKETFAAWKTQLGSIIAYWTECHHPKRFNR